MLGRFRVSILFLATALLDRFAATHAPALTGVRHVLMGGDVASAETIRKVLSVRPGLTITNGYGPTETTTFAACWTSSEPVEQGAVPIGTPIDETEMLILDDHFDEVVPGEPGDLYVGGTGLAWGYLGLPGETAARFVPDPRPGAPGRRLYRTGDVGRGVRMVCSGFWGERTGR